MNTIGYGALTGNRIVTKVPVPDRTNSKTINHFKTAEDLRATFIKSSCISIPPGMERPFERKLLEAICLQRLHGIPFIPMASINTIHRQMWRLALEGTFPGIPFTSLKGSAVRGSAATGLYKHCRYEAQLQHFRLEFHCLLLEPGNIANLPPGAYVAECQVIGSKEFEAAQALLSIAGNYSSYCSAVCATPPTNAIGQAIAHPPVLNRPADVTASIASPATPAANDSITVEVTERETAQKWSITGNSVVVHVVSRDNSGGEGPPADAQVLVKGESEGETGIVQDGQLQQSGRSVDLVSYCDSVVRGDRGQGEAGVMCEEGAEQALSATALCKKRAFTETATEGERKCKESRHVENDTVK